MLWQTAVVQLAHLNSILLTLGHELGSTIIEVRDFDAEVEEAERLAREAGKLSEQSDVALPPMGEEFIVKLERRLRSRSGPTSNVSSPRPSG